MSWQHFALGRMSEGLSDLARYFELLGDVEVAATLRDGSRGPQAAMLRGAEVLAARAEATFVKPNNLVHLFGWGGDVERAVTWFERSYEIRDHEVAYMAVVPTSAAVRHNERFLAVLRKLRLPLPRER